MPSVASRNVLIRQGSFTFLNTLTLHLLRLAPPWAYYKRRLRFPLRITATFGPPQREGQEGERRWQAAAAGAIASLGLLFETRARRKGVAQQYATDETTLFRS